VKPTAATNVTSRPWVSGLMITMTAFVLGAAVFFGLRFAVELLWGEVPELLPTWLRVLYVLAVPTLAGVAVATMRRNDANGHNPLAGFKIEPATLPTAPWLLAAVAVSLCGGLVIGPEAALVVLGCTVGTEIARHRGDIAMPTALKIGVGSAFLVMLIEPIAAGTLDLSPRYSFTWLDLLGTVAVGLVAAAVLAAGRLLAIYLLRLRGGDIPDLLPMALTGLAVGALAIGYHLFTGEPEMLVLTSGEGQIRQLAAVTGTGLIALTTAIKWVAYSLSMGGGFRGGPFFPAMFVGAGVGLIAASVFPSGTGAAAAGGLAAAISYLAHAKWAATVAIGGIIGLLSGGLPIIPATVLAAVMAKLVPLVLLDESTSDETVGITLRR